VSEAGSSVPGLMAGSTPCIGRERQLAQIWEQLRTSLCSELRVVVVTGEPGIGKTRLLSEVAVRAVRAGLTVLSGGSSEAAGMPPYLPFLEALGTYMRTAPAEVLREQAGAHAASLAGIFPELGWRLGEVPPTYPLPADQALLRLYQAVGAFLEAVAAGGLVLMFDDLQWADSSSLDLIVHVARHRHTARLLFLMACRADDVALSPVLDRTLAELTRLRVLTTINLPPLVEPDIAALAAGHLHGPVDAAASRQLYAHSEGNPFFAEELLCAWLQSGALSRTGSQLAWRLTLAPDETLPASIVSAIRLRLIHLPPDVVDHLRVAAMIGRTFDVELLAKVQRSGPAGVEDRLADAERAGLIRADQVGGYTFCHDKVRECLYSEVSSTRRQVLHARIGEALEADQRPGDRWRIADLAFHFARSRDTERGVTYLRQAAAEAVRTYAPQQAVSHLQMALSLVSEDDPQRGTLLLTVGEAALMAADDATAKTAFAAARTWFEHREEHTSSARAAYGAGIAHWRLDEGEAARQSLETALTLLDAAPHPEPAFVQTLIALANLLGVVIGRHDEAIGYGRQALEIAHQLEDRALEAGVSRTFGFLLVRDNDLAAGIALLEQALASAQAEGDPVEVAACCAYLAQAYCWSAALERSRVVSLLREATVRAYPQPHEQSYVYTWLAFLEALRGAWVEAERYLALAEPAVVSVASLEPRAFLQQVRGYLAYQQGDYRRAARELRTGIEIFRTQDPSELLLCLGLYGLALQATGRFREARACIAEQEALTGALRAGSLAALSARGCLALMAVGVGDTALAAGHYDALLVCRGQHHWFLVDRVLGEITALAADWSAAARHLDEAEQIAEREGLLPEMGRVLLAQANLELARDRPGNLTRARLRLTQSLALYRDLHLGRRVQEIRQRLRELPAQATARPSAPVPAALSPREIEVLCLVAEGKRNREIAEALSISPSTVAKHVTAIFNKTGCDNRAAATAFALRHGLA
jgi:DNA-binding CsgD family transcriptional regulator